MRVGNLVLVREKRDRAKVLASGKECGPRIGLSWTMSMLFFSEESCAFFLAFPLSFVSDASLRLFQIKQIIDGQEPKS